MVSFSSRPPYPQGDAVGTRLSGELVGSRAGLDGAENRNISCPCQEYNQVLLLSILLLSHRND
jgi:hypothetical protein